MDAYYDTSISFSGNKEERQAFAGVLKLYSTREHSGAFFRFDDKEIEAIENSDSESVGINASGPWGNYGELNDVGIFREIAEAAPNAEMYGHIEGSGTYDEQDLKTKLKDGKLYILTYFYSYEAESELYTDHFMEKLPYEKFIELFKIDGDEFDEDMYREFAESYAEELINEDLSFDYFMDEIDCSEIEEDEYNEAIETLHTYGLMTHEDFRDSGEAGTTERLIYDPVKREYIKGNPFPAGIAVIDDVLEEQMDEDDERDVGDLSVEEAYDLFTKAYEKEEDDLSDVELFNELFPKGE